jgi:RNA polymerase sigma factor (sigma-70 family)
MPQPVDAAMIAELFDRHAAALTLYARQWTAAADDCVQEAFIELARQAESPISAVAWLYRVTRNRALNASRATLRRTTHEQASATSRSELNLRKTGPEQRLEIAELLLALRAQEREIIVLRVWGGLSWQEIAELTGVSKSSAQRTYVQALEQLRRLGEPNHV